MTNQTPFSEFAAKIHRYFQLMQDSTLYELDIESDALWEHYLASFPEGTNPVFRERTEHDCACCRQFIKTIGKLATIEYSDGELVTRNVWNSLDLTFPYDQVAQSMSELLSALPIKDVYKAASKHRQFGSETSLEPTEDGVHTWHHFHARVNDAHTLGLRNTRDKSVAEYQGDTRMAKQVLTRGLSELDTDAVQTVLDLIDQGSLYRGEEHRQKVKKFQSLQATYHRIDPEEGDLFAWKHSSMPEAGFRNTVIGTLVTDLSDGVELETAVKKFESKVAPENYKRSSALVTPAMISKALDTLDTLDLRDAVDRRHAQPSDVSVNDVIYASGKARQVMKDALAQSLLEETRAPQVSIDNAAQISIEDFISHQVPGSTSIQLLLDKEHLNKFVSLTAPVHDKVEPLFKWRNNFAWSYDGEVTDSLIRQRVQKAGGNVDALMRVSLSWDYGCDLDIHIYEPDGNHIHYGNKSGKLDVDANAGGGFSMPEPVENVNWVRPPMDGEYRVIVHNYAQVQRLKKGFELEVEASGAITQFEYAKAVAGCSRVKCFTLLVEKGHLIGFTDTHSDLAQSSRSQDKWGLSTGSLVPVDMLCLSPNHWAPAHSGNKHYFFILENCLNPEPVRGIYNEFLRDDLHDHRKVFEVLGSKTRAPFSEQQLSGLGFSSTQRASVKALVTSSKGRTRAFTIQF